MMATNSAKSWRRWFRLIAITAGPMMLALVGGAFAGGNPNPGIAPVDSHPHGATYGEWSARWWQWAYSMPVDQHPLYDTADCSAGQTGKVWFLGGSFVATPPTTPGGPVMAIANRDCSIPTGTALFVAIANSEASTAEGNGTTDAELRAAAKGFTDGFTTYSCEIDGVSVEDLASYRVQSPLYTFGPLPDNNILQSFGLDAPAGTTSPSVADGIQIMIEPLSAGQHTIHFHAEMPGFLLDITYNITMTPGG
jgi:hypothetical protein